MNMYFLGSASNALATASRYAISNEDCEKNIEIACFRRLISIINFNIWFNNLLSIPLWPECRPESHRAFATALGL